MPREKKSPLHFREENRPDGTPTRVGLQALVWLNRRNGTGVFGISKAGVDSSSNVLLAAGDRGPFMRTTWNELRDMGYITIEGKRLTVTDKGAKVTFMPAPYPARKTGGVPSAKDRGDDPMPGKTRGLPSGSDAMDGAFSIEELDEEEGNDPFMST